MARFGSMRRPPPICCSSPPSASPTRPVRSSRTRGSLRNVSPTFFASVGVTVGALVLVSGWRRRAIVLAAAATAEICVNVFHGGIDVAPAAGYALANMSEASLAAFLIVMIARGAPLVERRGLAGLLVGVLVAPWLGGSIAAAVWALDGGDVDTASYVGHWWLGDALGILLVGGGLIAAATEERRARPLRRRARGLRARERTRRARGALLGRMAGGLRAVRAHARRRLARRRARRGRDGRGRGGGGRGGGSERPVPLSAPRASVRTRRYSTCRSRSGSSS